MRILIVEDKQESRYLLKVLLKKNGYEVVAAKNGKIALEMIDDNRIDLIISDILMPEMDGFKFCQLIKKDQRKKNIPFVFYTATYIDQKDEKFAKDLGADLFLRKPIEPEIFLKKIESIASKLQQGKYVPQETKLKNNGEIYHLYNERLIKKLEDKINELEKEVEKRTKIELELQKTIQEKNTLLQELYHRTKNNLQVISSMMRLKSSYLQNREIEKIFHEIENKILCMALVHQKLYESKNLSQLSLKKYFQSITELLKKSLVSKPQNIKIQICGDEIEVLIDTAMPLGIALNEIITNSINHAFPDHQKGEIKIKLQLTNDNEMVIDISDNGIGLPDNFDQNNDLGFGLQTVKDLVTYQLQGKFMLIQDKSFHCKIIVKEGLYEPRI